MEGEAWGLGAHPNKPRCVTASDDKSVMVWDLEAHRMLSVLSLGKQARCVGYSHDGAAIAVGMKDGESAALAQTKIVKRKICMIHAGKKDDLSMEGYL